jgi:murein L,D-transpeptidase YcbB/YkuD
MKQKRLFSILFVAVACITLSAGPASSQTSSTAGEGRTEMEGGKGQRTGEDKMEAKGAQEPGQMESERKKGEAEMEARGAQKPGRMEKPGAEKPEAKDADSESWTKEDIQKAQEALKSKGHDPGSIDGVISAQTREAIRAFQNANGLEGTGSLDTETAKELGIARENTQGMTSKDMGNTSPTQKQPSLPTRK